MASYGSDLVVLLREYLPRPTVYGPLTLALVIALIIRLSGRSERQPPKIPERIPFVSNAYLYMSSRSAFIEKAAKVSEQTGSNVLWFWLGPKKVYLTRGAQNVRPLLRVTNDFGSEAFIAGILRPLDMSPVDIAKFASDNSGRIKRRAPWSKVPEDKRVWYGLHRIYDEFMTRAHYSNCMAEKYHQTFSSRLTSQPLNQWTDVSLFGFLKHEMAYSSLVSLVGTQILSLSTDFVELCWEYDEVAFYHLPGPPKWWNRKPYEVFDRFNESIGRYMDSAWENFDWDGPLADSDWEEQFGSRFAREMIRWFVGSGMTMQSARGWMCFIVFALISNIVPITTWVLYEVIRDPSLLREVREEVLQAYDLDPTTGERTLDTQKLLSLPLLQSILIETLRVHLSLNLFREVSKPEGIYVDGYHIKKGCLVMVMTSVAHFDEATWGTDGHPASEFWAHRHMRKTSKTGGDQLVPEFSVAGEAGTFVPFGGGSGICPGRFIAKQEIFMTLATIVTRFDVEFVEWRELDGSPSDRPAQNDARYGGAIAVPPDREMKIRWKRLW